MSARTFAPFLMLLATACVSASGDFPSLAPRPIERLSIDEPISSAPAESTLTLPSDVATAIGRAEAAQAAFDEEARTAAARIETARGAPAGSEAWIAAQQALSRVEAAREPLTAAQTALDAAQTAGTVDAASLAPAQARLMVLAERQKTTLARLNAGLSTP